MVMWSLRVAGLLLQCVAGEVAKANLFDSLAFICCCIVTSNHLCSDGAVRLAGGRTEMEGEYRDMSQLGVGLGV